MQFKTVNALFLTAGLSVCALGQVTPQGGGYLLRAKFTPGTEVKYAMNISFTMPGAQKPTAMNMPVSMKVVSVKNGVADIDFGGIAMPGAAKPAKPTRVQIDSRYRSVSGQSPSTISYPAGPVKVGQSWGGSMPTGMGADAKANYTFKGVKKVNGKQMAVIAVTLNVAGRASGAGSGTCMVSAADGLLSSMTMGMKLKVAAPQGAGAKGAKDTSVQMTMGMKRI